MSTCFCKKQSHFFVRRKPVWKHTDNRRKAIFKWLLRSCFERILWFKRERNIKHL